MFYKFRNYYFYYGCNYYLLKLFFKWEEFFILNGKFDISFYQFQWLFYRFFFYIKKRNIYLSIIQFK